MDAPIATIEQSCDRATELDLHYGPGLVTVIATVGEILHNYGGIRQLDLVVGVAYDTDIGTALSAIDEVLRSNGKVLTDPAPVIPFPQREVRLLGRDTG